MELKDKISIGISVGALVVALLSLSLSGIIYLKESKEDLLIKFSNHHFGYKVPILKGYGNKYPAIIPLRWNCLIVNNGKIPVTISNIKTIQISSDFPLEHSNVSSSFIDSKNKNISTPLTLQPGEAKTMKYVTTILLTPEIYNHIKDKYPIGTKVLSHKLKAYLFSKGVDFYGNKVKQTIFSDGTKLITYPIDIKQGKQQIFVMKVTTSRANTFSIMFSQYQQFD
ncbi:hypothetical protein [Arcobacter sp. LA11]|uniref:hypothetical protein n=1 Tax=Arcobacter sp. LA11 TaxID=1898176 RepID=UPI0009349D01|nr:hypothetical protein [Arcobacter sp. LA11]